MDSPCPNELTLASYLDDLARPAERTAIETHVRSCPTYRETVSILRTVTVQTFLPLSESTQNRLCDQVSRALSESCEQSESDGKASVLIRSIQSIKKTIMPAEQLRYLGYAATASLLIIIFVYLYLFNQPELKIAQWNNDRSGEIGEGLGVLKSDPVTEFDVAIEFAQNRLSSLLSRTTLTSGEKPESHHIEDPGLHERNTLSKDAVLFDLLVKADKYRSAGNFNEALIEYEKLKDNLHDYPSCSYKSEGGSCGLHYMLSNVYIPVCLARCRIGLQDYDLAMKQLENVSLRLSSSEISASSCKEACACEICECLGKEMKKMLDFCEQKAGNQFI